MAFLERGGAQACCCCSEPCFKHFWSRQDVVSHDSNKDILWAALSCFFFFYYSLCCRKLYAVTLVQHSLATSPRTIRLCGRRSPPCFRHSTECFALCMSLANMSSRLTAFSFSCGIRNSGVRLVLLCGNWKTNTPNLTSSQKKKLQELKRSASAARMWVQLGMRWIFLQYRLFKNFKGTNREHFKMRPESHEYLHSVSERCQSLGSFA